MCLSLHVSLLGGKVSFFENLKECNYLKKEHFRVTAQGSQNQPGLGRGEGLLKKLHTGGGGLRPEVQPFTLEHTFFERKGTPFVYLLSTNGTPFTYLVQNLESLSILINHTPEPVF